MLTEMAGMSVEDGLTMQLHPGSIRNHNRSLYAKFGRDKGADIPAATEYTRNLRPLLSNTAMIRGLRSSCSRSTRLRTRVNWHRWRDTILRCIWGRRGGSRTRPRA